MEEYGGYIEFEYFRGREYHERAIALNSGRHCLEYVLRAKNIKKLYIPYFLCDSIKTTCDKVQVEVEYYHVNENFWPICEKKFQQNEWIYLVNYYGQFSNKMIQLMANQYGNVIVDNVQAFFQRPVTGIQTLYSCRKFFGVADGGYLYTDSVLEDELEQDSSYDRMTFLFGRLEKGAEEFYTQHVLNDRFFDKEPIKTMSRTTKNLMQGIQYEYVKNRRKKNFEFLQSAFKEINKLNIIVPEGAYMYPLFINGGAEIRKDLHQKKIYVPTLWSNVLEQCEKDSLEYNMAQNILPLPVDQRYTVNNMAYIVSEVKKILKRFV